LRLRPRRGGRQRPPVDLFVTAATAGDLGTARTLAADYLAQTRSRTALVNDLLAAAMTYVSRLWRFGRASAVDENNVAMAIAEVNEAVRLERPEPESRAPKALMVTIEPEQHSLGLDLVATALREDGWDPMSAIGIGRADLLDMVTRGGFRVVVISSTCVSALNERLLVGAVEALGTLDKPVIAGGQAFDRNPALAEVVGATMLAHDPRTAMVMARRFRERDWRRPKRGAGRAARSEVPSRESALARARL
jgi:methanogenic corrinoid protein MtbC1